MSSGHTFHRYFQCLENSIFGRQKYIQKYGTNKFLTLEPTIFLLLRVIVYIKCYSSLKEKLHTIIDIFC